MKRKARVGNKNASLQQMHSRGHGNTHRGIRAFTATFSGMDFTPLKSRKLPSWSSCITTVLFCGSSLSKIPTQQDHKAFTRPKTRPSHTSCVGRLGHATEQSTALYPSALHAHPEELLVDLGEESNDLSTGKQKRLV